MKPFHVVVATAALILFTQAVSAQSGGHYRDFQLGATLASVAETAGVSVSEAKTLHERPAVLQELQWRRPYFRQGGTTVAVDPVQQIAFSFCDAQLYRIAIDYERDRTLGLTDADVIAAVSGMYGPTVKLPSASTAASDEESGVRIAQWGDAEYSAVLYRSSYGPGFRLIVTSLRLSGVARRAEAQATRLDEREAPQREKARLKKEDEDGRAAQEKARVANKAAFTP